LPPAQSTIAALDSDVGEMGWLWIFLLAAVPEMTREEAIKLATETLAHELGLGTDLVELRRASSVDWPDSSLGCPEEGKTYLPVVTPGYLVSLQVDGQVFSVHVGPDRALVCGKAMRPVEGATTEESFDAEDETPIEIPEAPGIRELVMHARSDLAKRLGVAPETIDLLEASEVVWPDASLGCPQPGKGYAQSTREGYLIRLRSGKRAYRYHSGQGGAPFLCESPAR
jgi:hypothetical protein